MSNANENKPVGFQFKAIELLDFYLTHPGKPLPDMKTYNFDIRIDNKINLENNLVFIIVSIDIIHEDKETKLGGIKVSCIYNVENLKDICSEKDNSFLLPDDIMMALNSISISTTRGAMFSQFRGTFIHNAVLPIIDPKSFIQKKV
ncbi:MAG: hypothetical protein NT175_07845 [Bacteroidetes bacterium]|nr:hypothetical protein [Bacteroidota bacterium]